MVNSRRYAITSQVQHIKMEETLGVISDTPLPMSLYIHEICTHLDCMLRLQVMTAKLVKGLQAT